MTHDTLCYRSHDQPLGRDPFCQCAALVKAREDERSNNFTPDDFSDGMTGAYLRGLDAAREAVAEFAPSVWIGLIKRSDAVLVIDALRKDAQ